MTNGQSEAEREVDAKVAVLETAIASLQKQLNDRIHMSRESLALALTAAEKTTAIAQQTADKAMAKADAKADMVYLEAQIRSLKEQFQDQITSAQSALRAAFDSSEKAITKAEESNEKRFQSVNEFRAQLADQQKTFVVKDEAEFKFTALEKKLDESAADRRRLDSRFNDYLPQRVYDNAITGLTEWRRQVDASLIANASAASASKSTVQTGRDNVSLGIAIAAVLIALAVAVMRFQGP